MSRLRRYDYLLSFLPGLDSLGSTPPMGKQDLLARVAEAGGPVRTVQVILLSDDLMQREALLAGEIAPDQVDLAVLSATGAENGLTLPDFLLPEEAAEGTEGSHLGVDALWSRFFRHALAITRQTHSGFLKGWVGFEVGLRNALAAARAQSLGLDPATYLVAPELADPDLDVTTVLSAWSAAAHPLAGLEVLDKARWDWVSEHGRWFSFRADEIEAYAAKLILMHRWRRLASARPQGNKRTTTAVA